MTFLAMIPNQEQPEPATSMDLPNLPEAVLPEFVLSLRLTFGGQNNKLADLGARIDRERQVAGLSWIQLALGIIPNPVWLLWIGAGILRFKGVPYERFYLNQLYEKLGRFNENRLWSVDEIFP